MTNEKEKGRNLPHIINLNNNKMEKGTKVVLYQVTPKAGKVAKIQADSVEQLISLLYKGLKIQQKYGRRFLRLGAGTRVFIPSKNEEYFVDLQKMTAKAMTEKEMLGLFNDLETLKA